MVFWPFFDLANVLIMGCIGVSHSKNNKASMAKKGNVQIGIILNGSRRRDLLLYMANENGSLNIRRRFGSYTCTIEIY